MGKTVLDELAMGGTGTTGHTGVVSNPWNSERMIGGSSAGSAAAAVLAAAPVATGGAKVTCPLPGTVISINVKEGDTVSAGQTVVVLEAMKMENNIDAERGGVVKQVLVSAGATVMEGDVLLVIE